MRMQRMDYGPARWDTPQLEAEARLKRARNKYREADAAVKWHDCDCTRAERDRAKQEVDAAGKAMTEAFSRPARF